MMDNVFDHIETLTVLGSAAFGAIAMWWKFSQWITRSISAFESLQKEVFELAKKNGTANEEHETFRQRISDLDAKSAMSALEIKRLDAAIEFARKSIYDITKALERMEGKLEALLSISAKKPRRKR